jgi:hypothetical protein
MKYDSFLPMAFLLAIAWPGASLAQSIKAVGTGRTTGHIATISVINKGKAPLQMRLGPFFIPAAKERQGYGVPDVYELAVPPKSTVEVPIYGFCTHPALPPVAQGAALPAFKTWVTPTEGAALDPETGPELAAGFQPRKLPIEGPVATYPGTERPFYYTLDIDKYPQTAAKLVLDIIYAVEDAYAGLDEAGLISTPFAPYPERQASSIKQQVIWHVLGIVTGVPYEQDDFRENMAEQFEAAQNMPLDAAAPEVQQEFEQGLTDFWGAITLVGIEAKVLTPAAGD